MTDDELAAIAMKVAPDGCDLDALREALEEAERRGEVRASRCECGDDDACRFARERDEAEARGWERCLAAYRKAEQMRRDLGLETDVTDIREAQARSLEWAANEYQQTPLLTLADRIRRGEVTP